VATGPRFAFDIGCADLLHLDEVQSHIAVPVTLEVDETRPEIVDLPLAQEGGLTCIWGGSDRTDGGYGQGVQVRMLPNAASAFAAWKASGPRKHCSGGDAPVFCTTDFIVGGTWVELDLKDLTAADSPHPEIAADAVAGLVTRRLTDAEPRSIWSAPKSALTPISDCAAATAAATTVLGAATGTVHPIDETLDPGTRVSLFGAIRARAGVAPCDWTNADGSATLTWQVLTGGAWAFDGFDRPQQLGLVTGFRRVTVPGADQAWIACADSCVALLDVRGSFVTLFTDYGLDQATLIARATRAVSAFAD
jgi:hypothetical protein